MSRTMAFVVAWLLATAIVAALAVAPVAAQKSDPFYSALLDEGVRAFQRGDYLEAGEDLRIAAFGLLETPGELARALTYLALAQSGGGDLEAFERTHARLNELESRFGAYSTAAIAPEIRSALESAASARLGSAGLGLSVEAESTAQATAAASKPRPQLCIAWNGQECRQVAVEPAATQPSEPAGTPAAEDLAAFERLDLLASSRASSRQLSAGLEEAIGLAERHPGWPEMQRVAAVLASRSGSFTDAVHYYERSGDRIGEGPLQLFYLSVALFETDRPDAAASILRRALPALEQNREVRKYVRRILPEEGAG